ncbi:hypothetical protein ACCO45_012307 [Purpureocillium lilacinum]|uniref:Uncharacterized protein n=1 Tax=Purpureocillium lilacinum TaxID=33203 RepID=A0ACC4D9Q7_PURLI
MDVSFAVRKVPEEALLRWMGSKVMLGPRATLRPALLVLIEFIRPPVTLAIDADFSAWAPRSSVRRWRLRAKAAGIGLAHRWLLDGLPFIRASAVKACAAARVRRRGKGKSRLGDTAEAAIILRTSVVFIYVLGTTIRMNRRN